MKDIYEHTRELQNLIAELEETKEMYRTLSRVSPVGIFRTNNNNKCVYVNEKWLEIAGMKFDDALGDGWKDALCPNDRYKVVREWNRCSKEGMDFYLEYRFQNPNGRITWVLGQATLVNGGGNGHVGTITDITSKKEVLPQLIELRNSVKCRS